METIKKVNILNRVFLCVVCIITFVILFLFALNGRYYSLNDGAIVIDKWRKEAIRPGTQELPYIENGVDTKF